MSRLWVASNRVALYSTRKIVRFKSQILNWSLKTQTPPIRPSALFSTPACPALPRNLKIVAPRKLCEHFRHFVARVKAKQRLTQSKEAKQRLVFFFIIKLFETAMCLQLFLISYFLNVQQGDENAPGKLHSLWVRSFEKIWIRISHLWRSFRANRFSDQWSSESTPDKDSSDHWSK